ncbi:hypothetical protein FHX81_1521 [Saccharothrix saharensis]|uniref:Integral membrane protein n=1 Tax=Saccharothrix saharensis TaxID=571190 RepID=A0A543J8R8_9PSEU|nr:hypothetical protein [Saccharothrix saharensis]TQM79222.1 hypothetical protein FHX81_1521 [Saccharothrix saharensis]
MRPEDVVELRVHGVSGTPPEDMLGDPFPTAVAGDDVARFLRAGKPVRAVGTGRERMVEAFHWGRFTSGGASRALWLVLIPFAILNLARYTLLGAGRFAEAVLRLLALVLTCMLVTATAYVSLELLVRQCAGTAACRVEHLGFFDGWPFGAMLLVGMVPPGLVITVLWWFGRQTFLYEPKGTHHVWETRTGSLGDYAFWHTSPRTPVLRDAHVAAACAVVGVLYAGALRTAQPDRPSDVLSWTVVGLGALVLAWAVGCVVMSPDRREVDSRALKWASVLYLLLAAGLATAFLWRVPTGSSGAVTPLAGFEAVTNVLSALAMLLLLVLLGACVRMRHSARGVELVVADKRFRPLWHGYAAVVIAALATTLAVGFSGGLAYRVVDWVGEPVPEAGRAGLVLSTSYLVGAGLWGVLAIAFPLLLAPVVAAMVRQVSSAVLFAAGSVAAAVAVGLRWAHEGWGFWAAVVVAGALYAVGAVSCMRHAIGVAVREGVVADYPGRPDRPGIGKVALTQRVAAAKYRYHWLLGALALLGGVLVLAGGGLALARLAHPQWRAAPPAGLADWLSTVPARELGALGSLVVSGVVLVLLLLGVRTWQSPKMRTVVGIVWDLVAFWPRLAHPICPPPYGGRATIELTSRAVRLAGHHDVGAVVLSGHSQGSVVCFAALSLLRREAERPDPADGERYIRQADAVAALRRVGLVTYGSQLQWAYSRLFPHYLGHAELARLHDELGDRWWNVHRATDPLGGPVQVWPETAEERVHAGAKLWGVRCGNDVRLRDPEFLDPDPDMVASPLRGHSYYYDDPVFDEVVARVADAVAAPRTTVVLGDLTLSGGA